MNINELIKETKNITGEDKDRIIRKHIKDIYIPYAEKIVLCQKIIDCTFFDKIDGVTFIKKNSPVQLMLYSLSLIQKYTDIEIDMTQPFVEYDLLCENDLIGYLLDNIPSEEYLVFDTLMEMISSDSVSNYSDLIGCINSKSHAIDMFIKNFDNLPAK